MTLLHTTERGRIHLQVSVSDRKKEAVFWKGDDILGMFEECRF
jgi:hypothetical protein